MSYQMRQKYNYWLRYCTLLQFMIIVLALWGIRPITRDSFIWPPPLIANMYEPIWRIVPELARADDFIRQFKRPQVVRGQIIFATWRESRILWEHPKTRQVFADPAEPFYLLLAQQAAESGCNPLAKSPLNPDGSRDLGLAQHNSRYLLRRGITDWRNVNQQARAQALFMCSLLQASSRWGGERAIRAALAGYTAGPTYATLGIVPDKGRTRPHVARIMRYYRQLAPVKVQKGIYIVRKGDTLTKIAKRFGTTVKKLAEINGIHDVNLILVGQKLII